MNYISQLNGFRRWRGQHALSPFAQLLWYSLTVEQNQGCGQNDFASPAPTCARSWAASVPTRCGTLAAN